MKLSQLISNIETLPDSCIIYAERNPCWNSDSESILLENEMLPQDTNKNYLIEVSIAKEVIEVWEAWHKRKPSFEEKLKAIIYYSENDSYMP